MTSNQELRRLASVVALSNIRSPDAETLQKLLRGLADETNAGDKQNPPTAEGMEAIMREIADRLRSFNDYPFAFEAHAGVRRTEIFETIAKAITAKGKPEVQK